MKKIIWNICIVICFVTAACSIWKLYGYYHTYQNGKEEYDDLTEYTRRIDSSSGTAGEDKTSAENEESEESRCPIKVDFKALKKINPDVAGWIYIPDTGINYPIVQAKDNSTYLHRTFRGEDSYIGAIFLDAMCEPDFTSFNSIIYGHNLKNGEMFGHLKVLYDQQYNDEANYKEHPVIWIITPEDEQEYEIYAFREIDAEKDHDVYTVELYDPESISAFFDEQISKSQKDTGIRPEEDKRMITLSTCTSRTEKGRFIVQACIK